MTREDVMVKYEEFMSNKEHAWNNVYDYSSLKYKSICSDYCLLDDDPEFIIDSLREFKEEVRELEGHFCGTYSNRTEAQEYGSVEDYYLEYEYYVLYSNEEIELKLESRNKSDFKEWLAKELDVSIYKIECKLVTLLFEDKIGFETFATLVGSDCEL